MTASTAAVLMKNASVGPWCSSAWPDAAVSAVASGSLIVSVMSCSWAVSGRDQVDEREDEDPHDVDEVPVQADHLDGLRLVARDAIRSDHRDECDQHDDADRHVDAVEAGQRVEAGGEEAVGEAEALAVEARELVDLAGDEQASEAGGGTE